MSADPCSHGETTAIPPVTMFGGWRAFVRCDACGMYGSTSEPRWGDQPALLTPYPPDYVTAAKRRAFLGLWKAAQEAPSGCDRGALGYCAAAVLVGRNAVSHMQKLIVGSLAECVAPVEAMRRITEAHDDFYRAAHERHMAERAERVTT